MKTLLYTVTHSPDISAVAGKTCSYAKRLALFLRSLTLCTVIYVCLHSWGWLLLAFWNLREGWSSSSSQTFTNGLIVYVKRVCWFNAAWSACSSFAQTNAPDAWEALPPEVLWFRGHLIVVPSLNSLFSDMWLVMASCYARISCLLSPLFVLFTMRRLMESWS